MAALVDTNVLVYRRDPRYPEKGRIARELLRAGLADQSIFIPPQAIIEFVSATLKPVLGGRPILTMADACREAEELINEFNILYPVEEMIYLALRGLATYRMAWFDAHLWAYAEYYGLDTIYSEDFQTDRLYGSVRIIDPFACTPPQRRPTGGYINRVVPAPDPIGKSPSVGGIFRHPGIAASAIGTAERAKGFSGQVDFPRGVGRHAPSGVVTFRSEVPPPQRMAGGVVLRHPGIAVSAIGTAERAIAGQVDVACGVGRHPASGIVCFCSELSLP
ncbi:MAG: PIN domain-containing protein [Rhodospirillales bacterium]